MNQDAAEIKMTRPVTTQVVPQKRTRTIDEEMCFWLGTPYESRNPPKPIGKGIEKNVSTNITCLEAATL